MLVFSSSTLISRFTSKRAFSRRERCLYFGVNIYRSARWVNRSNIVICKQSASCDIFGGFSSPNFHMLGETNTRMEKRIRRNKGERTTNPVWLGGLGACTSYVAKYHLSKGCERNGEEVRDDQADFKERIVVKYPKMHPSCSSELSLRFVEMCNGLWKSERERERRVDRDARSFSLCRNRPRRAHC